jgi:polyphenol oxidase
VTSRPVLPAGVRRVRETRLDGPVPLYVHPRWERALPWLAQGTTGRGDDGSWDFGLSGEAPVGRALARWRGLHEATGMARVAHSRQVHRDRVLLHEDGVPGITISDGFDGHITRRAGVLLTVTVADCVPISLVHPEGGVVALLHGGWRGAARGILARGLDQLEAEPSRVLVHLGPAICGRCYEVGPEVHTALGLAAPAAPEPVDVRAALARQAVAAGVTPENITVSDHCTRCDPGFFSHRAGSAGRQLGILGIRP